MGLDTVLKIISIVFILIGAFMVYGASYINERIKNKNDSEESANNGGDDKKILNIKIYGACFVIAGVVMVLAAFR